MSIFKEKIKRVTQHVPWFNKSEWEEVSKQAYSEDRHLKDKAYKQMCVWKARDPKLPFGVECTMVILYVQLCDNSQTTESKEASLLPHSEKDLQLMYCTAIMRFINHLRGLSTAERSLYKMAYHHNIPDWIINLRHETAHGNNIPSLSMLRSAAQVILQWLYDHYWEAEVSCMQDYISGGRPNKDLTVSEVEHLLQVWLSTRLHEWAGINKICFLPNKNLRLELLKIVETYGEEIKEEDLPKSDEESDSFMAEINDLCEILDDEILSDDDIKESENDHQTKANLKLKDAMNLILNQISDFLEEVQEQKVYFKKSVVNILLENPAFLSPDVFEEDDSAVNEIEEEVINILTKLWYEVLSLFNSKNLMIDILETLITITRNDECIGRCRMSALWVHQLTKMLSESGNLVKQEGPSNIRNMYMQNILKRLTENITSEMCSDVNSILFNYLIGKSVKLHNLPLQPLSFKQKRKMKGLVKDAALNPTTFTSYILPGLLDLCERRMSEKAKNDLLKLVSVYTNGTNYEGSNGFMMDDDVDSQSIRTVESFLKKGRMLVTDDYSSQQTNYASSEDGSDEEEQETRPVNWVLYAGNEDWSKCALGITPWEHNSTN